MKLNFAPLAIAIVALCCCSIEVFAESSDPLVLTGSSPLASQVLSPPEISQSAEAKVPVVLQMAKRGRSIIKYGLELASGHTGAAADSALVSLRGGLTSVSRKAAAVGVELTVVW